MLFLSELESGARVVALGASPVRPVLEETLGELKERAARAGVELVLDCDPEIALAIRPRMLGVVARNLAENAIRYAGPGRSSRSRSSRTPTARSSSPPRTTASGSRKPRCRGSSSASTAAIAPGRLEEAVSGSPSSSTW